MSFDFLMISPGFADWNTKGFGGTKGVKRKVEANVKLVEPGVDIIM